MQLQLRNIEHYSNKPYKGLIDAALTISREEGFMALYKGAIPALMLTSHGGVQFVAYEYLKKHFAPVTTNNSNNKSKRSVLQRLKDSTGYLVMGAVSKIIASTTTYPLQVIKSRLQQRSQSLHIQQNGKIEVINRDYYKGVVSTVKRIWMKEGLLGFFKGAIPNALRVAPSAAVTFVVYEGAIDFFAAHNDSNNSSKK